MFGREIQTEFRGHFIVVKNSWGSASLLALIQDGLGGATKVLGDETKLYIDGKMVDSTKELVLRSGLPLLRGCIEESGANYIVEVYGKAGWFQNLFKLYINNRKIGGDDF